MDSNFHQHALSNGLALVGETNPSARAVGLAFWVRTGARDEAPPVAGVSHFLEHMVFKGTETRDSLAVNREFSQIGAESNAFTSEENTVYYAVILPEYLPRAVDILADIMRPSLRGNDFDMEKMVILDEIARYAIQPHWEVYEHARKNYFGEQPLGYSVLGSTESIQELKVEAMRDYFAQRYVPSNLHVIATGNYDWNQLTDLVAAKCGHWQPGSTARTPVSGFRPQPGIHMLPRSAEKVGQRVRHDVDPRRFRQRPAALRRDGAKYGRLGRHEQPLLLGAHRLGPRRIGVAEQRRERRHRHVLHHALLRPGTDARVLRHHFEDFTRGAKRGRDARRIGTRENQTDIARGAQR